MRVLGRPLHRPEAPSFGVFWRLGRAQAKGDGRLGEMNRREGAIGFGSGRAWLVAGRAAPGRSAPAIRVETFEAQGHRGAVRPL